MAQNLESTLRALYNFSDEQENGESYETFVDNYKTTNPKEYSAFVARFPDVTPSLKTPTKRIVFTYKQRVGIMNAHNQGYTPQEIATYLRGAPEHLNVSVDSVRARIKKGVGEPERLLTRVVFEGLTGEPDTETPPVVKRTAEEVLADWE